MTASIAASIGVTASDRSGARCGGQSLGIARHDELEEFLSGIERRALRMAELATRDRDEALDLVQDAMTALVERYASRPRAEWAPLFHRILQNRIRDWTRRRALRERFRAWLGRGPDAGEDAAPDPLAAVADPAAAGRADPAERADAGRRLDDALRALPLRQRQAFLLRAWEGFDVAETARAMRCSQGSVKTHYFRAVQALRMRLGEDWA